MAAAFDKDLIYAVANATAYEARAKYNSYVRAGEYQVGQSEGLFERIGGSELLSLKMDYLIDISEGYLTFF